MGLTYQVLDELWSVSADSFYGLEDVHLPVLDDLLDAGVGSAVHAGPGLAVAVDQGRAFRRLYTVFGISGFKPVVLDCVLEAW